MIWPVDDTSFLEKVMWVVTSELTKSDTRS